MLNDNFDKISSKSEEKISQDNNYELVLNNATRNYVNNYYKDLKSGEKLIIKLSTLREYDYINLNNCSGYSIVKKEESLIIEPFIKCSDYVSSNYNEDFE